jgi:hypothetical protein
LGSELTRLDSSVAPSLGRCGGGQGCCNNKGQHQRRKSHFGSHDRVLQNLGVLFEISERAPE